jgi:glycosyltransferase involved in cell wall biosynthesis
VVRNAAALVAPDGNGSLAGYAGALGAALGAEPVVAEGCSSGFGGRVLSRASLSHLACEARAVRMLRALDAPLLHFTSHHLARYGPFQRAPYVVTVHDLMRHRDCTERGSERLIHQPNLRDRLHLRLDAAGLRAAAALIAVSDHTRRELTQLLGVPADRIHVVPEGVDCTAFRPVAGRPLEAPYVLYVGSEQPRKNLPTLFRAFARVRHAVPGLKLAKVGAPGGPEAPFRETTLAAARETGVVPDVVFANRVSHEELLAWYSGALCLVQPSRHEGFGLTPLEAMACGCPVIVSAGGALPEVVGSAGVVYGRPGDVDALAWELTRLLASRAERAALAEMGRERAARMSWRLAAERTRRVWAAALGERQPLVSRPRTRSRFQESTRAGTRQTARSGRSP